MTTTVVHIGNLFDDQFADDTLLTTDEACQAISRLGDPTSRRTVGRYKAMPDGLAYIEIGGRDYFRIGSLRSLVRSRERRPNPRRA